ncbi:serine/threonine-protein kinase [Nonomuraea aridisoli]|uniref:Serine/threonine protein kinase n=1 Tax=Nonomuraea aridisoli TaxID=2070368 RepID=A0A2W2DHS4_9ACTN|nr:serine/threonine-protein kinase [Nonomuraea aridisoli]PZG11472.1 serine/threonine protein kinase [Nonomuraea aridisoli]
MSELRADDPRQLGAYRLTRRLGQGGQGVVYLGHSPQGAQVAIKLLHASLSDDPDVRRRFLREVEAVRRVAAFCTAQLLDADLDGDRPYLVSEYVEGPSLREHVLERGPRRGGSLDRIAIGTATALGAIHRAGVVHRDFKPGNVLLGLDGPQVIDFGVSRLMGSTASTGHLPMGTPAYMAPERIKGEPTGPATDLWAWGLTMVFTATGRNAYAGGTYQEVLARVLYGRPDLSALSGRLREIVDACLAPEPGERPDAEEVLRLLLGQERIGSDVLTSGAMVAIGASARLASGTASDPEAAAASAATDDAEAGEGADVDATEPFDADFSVTVEADDPGDSSSAESSGEEDPDVTQVAPRAVAAPEGATGSEASADAESGREQDADLGSESGEAGDPAGTGGTDAGRPDEDATTPIRHASDDSGPVITDPDPTTSFPAITGRERPAPVSPSRPPSSSSGTFFGGRRTILVAVVAVLVVVAGLLLWVGAAHGSVPEETWTGSWAFGGAVYRPDGHQGDAAG